MAHKGALLAGIILLIIVFLGYIYPVSDNGYSIPEYGKLCDSGIGEIGKFFSSDVRQNCQLANNLLVGIYALGLIGIILVIVASVVPSKSKASRLTCPYCNFVALSEPESLKHQVDKHLDKSPYTCGRCDFIGITEEILWNHYNDNHPDEKKW